MYNNSLAAGTVHYCLWSFGTLQRESTVNMMGVLRKLQDQNYLEQLE